MKALHTIAPEIDEKFYQAAWAVHTILSANRDGPITYEFRVEGSALRYRRMTEQNWSTLPERDVDALGVEDNNPQHRGTYQPRIKEFFRESTP